MRTADDSKEAPTTITITANTRRRVFILARTAGEPVILRVGVEIH
jgi:hypothetical protein